MEKSKMVKCSTSSLILMTVFTMMSLTSYSQSGTGYYVSEVVSFQKGYVKISDDPDRFLPEKALGAPSDKFVSIGFGGELLVKFPAPVKNGEGADLRIHETSWGSPPCDSWPEKASIYVSQDNINWISLGTICQTESLSFPDDLDWILYVKIIDASDPDFGWYGTNIDGYDVNAIESLHGWLGPVIPLFDCVRNNRDGSFTAFLGYDNHDKLTFSIPIGERNFFSTATNFDQPHTFLPGLHESIFTINFDGNPVVWSLVGPDSVAREVKFSSSSLACPVAPPTARMSGDANLCGTEEMAEITVELTGTAPWTIVYENSLKQKTTVSGITASPYTFSSNESTTYTLVSVEDINGRGEVTGSATVVVYEKPTAEISGGGMICEEGASAFVTIQLSGVAPFTFTYSDGSQNHTFTDVNLNTVPIETKKAGQYALVSVSDQYCTGTVSGSADVLSLWIPLNLSAADYVCFGEEISLNSGLTESTDTYSWTTSGQGTFDNAQSLNPTYIPGVGESGEITFTFSIENECGVRTQSVKVEIKAPIDPDFTYPTNIQAHMPVVFTPVQNNADLYDWEITGFGSRQGKNPELTFTMAGAYEVSLKVTKDGCESSLTKIISVDDTKKVLYIPNVFSPWASNPENQVVKVYGSGISTEGFIFRILNRWGNVLYETTNLSVAQNTGWDGKARGTGEMQALGVYTFMLKGKFLDGEVIQRTGSITLVK